MKLPIISLAGVIALAISTTGAAQDTTHKPVTGADRKKTTAPAASTTPPTTDTSTTSSQAPSVSTSPTTIPSATTSTPVTTTVEPLQGQSATAPGQTGNTPGQEQTSPGQASQLTPAVTGQTPSGQTTGTASTTTQPTAATAADVKAGVSVFDQKGGLVGKIESVSAKGAVVSTGKTKAIIPVSSFAKTDKGLVMGMTKSELEAASAKAAPAPQKKK